MKYYNKQQITNLERSWYKKYNKNHDDLIQVLGQLSYSKFKKYFPKINSVCIVVGKGNNGSDGLAFAIEAINKGLKVYVWMCQKYVSMTHNQEKFFNKHSLIFDEPPTESYDAYIDAITGTGFQAKENSSIDLPIKWLNLQKNPVISLDTPSGINISGPHGDDVVNNQLTITFFGRKVGFLIGKGMDHINEVEVISPDETLRENGFEFIDQLELPKRSSNFHKGKAGRVCVVGSNYGMEGAGILSSMAALRSGVGYSYLYYLSSINHLKIDPSIMCQKYNWSVIEELILKNPVCLLGPGMGRNSEIDSIIYKMIEKDVNKIIDADALYMIKPEMALNTTDVLTPHYKEAAHLLNKTVEEVSNYPLESALLLNQRYSTMIVLKGPTTIFCNDAKAKFIIPGYPSLSTAGTGDVLSGIIASFIAQYGAQENSVINAIIVHSLASRIVDKKYGNGLIASDLLKAIAHIIQCHTL